MFTWRFTAVRNVLGEGELYERLPDPFTGTIEEALEHAHQLKVRRDWMTIRAEPPLPPLEENTGRAVIEIRRRPEHDGWMSSDGTWQLSVQNAVSYAASRHRGVVCEFRVFDERGDLQHFLLVDRRDARLGV